MAAWASLIASYLRTDAKVPLVSGLRDGMGYFRSPLCQRLISKLVPIRCEKLEGGSPRILLDRDHCSLMFAARITLPHLSVSATISVSNSGGDIGIGSLPRSARRVFMAGSA